MTFWPSTTKVFFCRLGLKTRLVRRKEKLTLWPNCLPFPVSSHRAVIIYYFHLFFTICISVTLFRLPVKVRGERSQRQKRNSCIIKRMNLDLVYIVTVIVVILFSMTLHEAMHGFMAYFLGDDTAKLQGRLTLNPVKHIDPFLTLLLPVMLAVAGLPIFGGAKPVPFNPARVKYDEWGAALVAIAGPLTNLLIAFVAYGVYALVGAPHSGLLALILTTTVMVNLGFFVFNMIPLPPLDGSRVLYALAPEFIRRGMEAIERFGIVVVLAIVLLASEGIGTYMLAAINFFVMVFSHIFGVS